MKIKDDSKTELMEEVKVPVEFKDKEISPDLKSLTEDFKILRDRVNNNLGHGGGNANRNIVVEGRTVLTPYGDINFVGTTASLIAATDGTNRQTIIQIPTSTGSIAGATGNNTEIQYNNVGSLGASSTLSYDSTLTKLSVSSTIAVANAGTSNALSIIQTGNTSASISIGGALNINNTNNTGAALVVYSNHGAGQVGRQLVVYSQASALAIDTALIQSDATNNTALNVKGVPTGKGVIKIEHLGNTAGDANGAAISVDLQGSGTAAQGIRVDATNGGTTGNLIGLYNAGTERFTVTATGVAKVNQQQVVTALNGSGVPGSTPNFIGQMYVDTSGKKGYIATGTTNSGDWKILN